MAHRRSPWRQPASLCLRRPLPGSAAHVSCSSACAWCSKGPTVMEASMSRRTMVIVVFTLACVAGVGAVLRADGDGTNHVLLLSVDGLHAGDLQRFVDTHPKSALAWLTARGRTFTHATATKPSDSFPGLLAMTTGGTPRSTGVYYDDGYDRTLAAAGTCTSGARVQWKQNLDVLPFSYTTTIDQA